MKLTINGEERVFTQPVTTLADLLAQLDIPAARTAIELNGAIVDQQRFAATMLNNADRVEIVSFVGGG